MIYNQHGMPTRWAGRTKRYQVEPGATPDSGVIPDQRQISFLEPYEGPLYLGGDHAHKWVDVSPITFVWDGTALTSGANWQHCHCGRLRRKST